jgi:hypothetical protein
MLPWIFPASTNVRVDRAARFHSTFAVSFNLQNTHPPLRSNELLDACSRFSARYKQRSPWTALRVKVLRDQSAFPDVMERTILSWPEAAHCHPTLIGFYHSIPSTFEVGKLPGEKLTGTFAGEPFIGRGFHTDRTDEYSVWARSGAATLIDFDRSVSHVAKNHNASNYCDYADTQVFINRHRCLLINTFNSSIRSSIPSAIAWS